MMLSRHPITLTLTFLLLTTIPTTTRAESWLLAQPGITTYYGDLPSQPHLSLGLQYLHRFNAFHGMRLQTLHTRLSGNDHRAPFGLDNYHRNLHFRSHLWEFSASYMLFPKRFQPGRRRYRWTPILAAGIGLAHINPIALYTDPNSGISDWVELQPLGTEGQGLAAYPDRKPYHLWQPVAPLSIGLFYNLSDWTIIGIEATYPITFTDYLDDVSKTYLDPDHLNNTTKTAQQTFLTQHFANRANGQFTNHHPSTPRGNPSTHDTYWTIGVLLVFSMF